MVDPDLWMNKVQIINRCLQRIEEEYGGRDENLVDFTKQDSIILNLQRCCEAAIDLAMHFCRSNQLGIPQSSREAFEHLVEKGTLSGNLAKSMKAMVGFRNIAVHDYQNLNIEILKAILKDHLNDFSLYINELKQSI